MTFNHRAVFLGLVNALNSPSAGDAAQNQSDVRVTLSGSDKVVQWSGRLADWLKDNADGFTMSELQNIATTVIECGAMKLNMGAGGVFTLTRVSDRSWPVYTPAAAAIICADGHEAQGVESYYDESDPKREIWVTTEEREKCEEDNGLTLDADLLPTEIFNRLGVFVKAEEAPTRLSDAAVANPRFVWAVGDYREAYPDMPEGLSGDGLELWDRQEFRTVALITRAYAQLLYLERTDTPNGAPFTALETWINSLDNDALESEGVPPTTAK